MRRGGEARTRVETANVVRSLGRALDNGVRRGALTRWSFDETRRRFSVEAPSSIIGPDRLLSLREAEVFCAGLAAGLSAGLIEGISLPPPTEEDR